MSAFEIASNIGAGRPAPREHPRMFARTRSFELLDRDHGWLKTSVVRLGRGVELWKVVSTGHEVALSEPDKFSCLIPQAGYLDVKTRDGSFRAASGDILLFSPNDRLTRVSPAGRQPYKALVVLIPAGKTEGGASVESAIPVFSGLGAGLRSYSAFLESEFERETTVLAHTRGLAAVSVMLEEFIADLLDRATAFEGRDPGRLVNGPVLVGLAEQIMAEHFDQPITIAQLARESGTSPRLLQLAFQRHRGHSPREALKRIRLDAARKRLSQAGETDSVSVIALDCGFTHFGRFSAEYRRTYGVLPSQQLKTPQRL